ncbi:MAG: hypothetical protein ACFFBD_30515 [Candidatus Hodarchaeota archaeon]
MVEGIPLNKLPKRRVTNEESVTAFFEENRDMAFTIDLLLKNGFTTNIRKVLARLRDQGVLEEVSISKGKRWELAYYYALEESYFELKKISLGWKLSEISINGIQVSLDLFGNTENGSYYLSLSSPTIEDIAVYYYEGEDWDIIRCVRYSEIGDQLSCENPTVQAVLDPGDAVYDWRFDFSHDGKQKRIAKNRNRVFTNTLIQYFGNLAFKFTVDRKKRFIIITALIWDEETEADDEDFSIDDVYLGCAEINREVDEEDVNFRVSESDRIVISY